jgi:hypothetical protein
MASDEPLNVSVVNRIETLIPGAHGQQIIDLGEGDERINLTAKTFGHPPVNHWNSESQVLWFGLAQGLKGGQNGHSGRNTVIHHDQRPMPQLGGAWITV